MEAFDTFNVLKIGKNTSKSIHFEKRRPQGTENLIGLLYAIKQNNSIKFLYHKYWEDHPEQRNVDPLALKEFKNRWYVIAKDLKDNKIKSFALDRLSLLEILKKRFTPPENFDVNSCYRHCFGIISPDEDQKVEEVILSFDPYQGKYIKSMPLHESQEIIADNQKELRIRLKIFITYDFLMEILSYGENVKVIQPEELKISLKTILRKALKQY
jgi:predicted DNA-binding transcriptional regulator YafY